MKHIVVDAQQEQVFCTCENNSALEPLGRKGFSDFDFSIIMKRREDFR